MAQLNGKPIGVDQLATLALVPYGHFTSMLVDHGRVRGLSLHLQRLIKDCRALFGTDLDPQNVREFVRRVAPPDRACVVRVTIFDPDLELGHPAAASDPQVLVTTRPASVGRLPGLRVRSRVYVRDLPQVKSVGLFATLVHRREAQRSGFDDALFVDSHGVVLEGGTWNLGFVGADDRLIWPDGPSLTGVTMQLLKEAADHEERAVRLADVPSMRAAFATNAAIGVRPITAIDGMELATSHPAMTKLQDTYAALGEEPL
ncbi:aminotransferase class IV family protein [Jiangella endophytica]|uniref:aminotransferase class IV family protein n=1 Tax=Jiangella endophytica TaxID=1623398 RepID=UPI000E3565D5|nr:aminotransferase class IV family protein [Jiangella endophytica]